MSKISKMMGLEAATVVAADAPKPFVDPQIFGRVFTRDDASALASSHSKCGGSGRIMFIANVGKKGQPVDGKATLYLCLCVQRKLKRSGVDVKVGPDNQIHWPPADAQASGGVDMAAPGADRTVVTGRG